MSPPKIDTFERSAPAFAAAFAPTVVDADALMALVVITDPLAGYEKLLESDGWLAGGAVTTVVLTPELPGIEILIAQACAEAPGATVGPAKPAATTTIATTTSPTGKRSLEDTSVHYCDGTCPSRQFRPISYILWVRTAVP